MDQARKNEIVAIILFAVSLFLFLSVFTFKEQDLSFYTSNANLVTKNVTGVAGAYTSGVLLFMIGRAAYVLPVLLFMWGLSRFFQMGSKRTFFRILGSFILIVAVSASLSMTADLNSQVAFSRGGFIGAVIADFLFEYLGKIGGVVFIAALISLSLVIATEFLILPIVAAIFRFMVKLPLRAGAYFSEKKEYFPLKTVKDGQKKLEAARKEVAKKLEGVRRQVKELKETTPVAELKVTAPVRAESASANAVPRTVKVMDSSSGEKVEYKLPPLDLLKTSAKGNIKERDEDLKRKAAMLEKTLSEFEVEAKVVKINRGPVITMYELEPAFGTKVNKITSLSDNISLAMKSANIRIVAPLPGKGTIGVEVPNERSESVILKDILETAEYREESSPLKIALGKDISGVPIVTDLAKMPHLLIAGATGSGKTVCLNCIITSLLYNSAPEELKFLMIDPKRVELMMFEGIPHLLCPIVTNPKKSAHALNWIVNEMERRYEIFAEKGTRNIEAYRQKRLEDEENLPFIIVVVDELADLMMVAQQDVEGAIMRIAQLSRAAGIHMILATQRPSVNVVTGVVKANFPARISFKVASKVDSRTVLDANGAEKLLGRGDMLLMQPGETSLIRGQCSLVEDGEIRNMVKFIKSQAGPRYIDEVVERQENILAGAAQEKDEFYHEAVRIVVQTKQASVSMIQRRLRVGYTRAARMIDIMEQEGIVGPYNGSKPREILVNDINELEGSTNDNDKGNRE